MHCNTLRQKTYELGDYLDQVYSISGDKKKELGDPESN